MGRTDLSGKGQGIGQKDRIRHRGSSGYGADHFPAEYSDVFAALSDTLHYSLHADLFLRFGCTRRYLVMTAFYYETVYCLDLLTGIFVGYSVSNPNFMLEQLNRLKIDRIIIYLFTRCVVIAILFFIFSMKVR